jgi:nitrite reductase/ring-hydroxylating ferredoxin subunit
MELPTFKEFNPNEYSTKRVDWLGRRLSSRLSVTAEVLSTPAGERQWRVYCNRCRNEYVLTDSQIDNPLTIICPCH